MVVSFIVKVMSSISNALPGKTPFYQLTKEKIFDILQSGEKGLSEDEAISRLRKFGRNTLTAKKKISALGIYLAQFKNTLTIILLIAACLILFIHFSGEKEDTDLVEAGFIFVSVFLITLLGFVQEYKAEKAIDSLKMLMAYKAKVKRDGIEKEIDVAELVPGDIVVIEEGMKIPADIRLLEAISLRVNEASLTGESVAVSKTAMELQGEKQLADRQNMLFAGTVASTGRGIGIVVKTGDATEIGLIARDVAGVIEDKTPMQKRLDDIAKTLGLIILVICAIVFIFIVNFAGEFTSLSLLQRIIQSFIAAVALAVAAIPEGMPAVVTVALALGTQRMLRKHALVRKLNSVETLGSTDVICTDKTGTLTKGEMTVVKIYNNDKLFEVSGTGYGTTGDFQLNGQKLEKVPFPLLLEAGYFCNNASLKDGKILGDPTEAALLVSAAKTKLAGINTNGKRIREIPFSSERKKMTVVVKKEDFYVIYTKGAVEVVLESCASIYKDNKANLLAAGEKKQIQVVADSLSGQTLRTLGFAYKLLSPNDYEKQQANEDLLESGLTFLGIQGMTDPPRNEVKTLITTCLQSGIRVIMITGDHVETAKAVAKEIGILGDVLSGLELEKLSDNQFLEVVEKINIYARVNPGVKMRIVAALKKKGHIVAMTGDGVNDAPALKKADIGVAMGITGTDVAKESSDMVLLDDKFSTIVSAIEEGRGIFHNIRKSVSFLLSCNIGEVLAIFLGVILFQKLILTATMILWVNIVTDGIPAIALGLDPSEKNIMRHQPKAFQTNIMSRRLWVEMGLFSIALTIAVLGIYFLDLRNGVMAAQSAAFMALIVFELVQLYIIRSGYNTSFWSNKWLIISIGMTMLLQIIILYVPTLASIFHITIIDWSDWLYILAASGLLWLFFTWIHDLFNHDSFFAAKE